MTFIEAEKGKFSVSFLAFSQPENVLLNITFCVIPYLLDQMPRLLFISSRNFVRLLFESGDYSTKMAFIEICKGKGFQKSKFYNIN